MGQALLINSEIKIALKLKVENTEHISHYFSFVYIMVWFAIVGPASSVDAREEILARDYMTINLVKKTFEMNHENVGTP